MGKIYFDETTNRWEGELEVAAPEAKMEQAGLLAGVTSFEVAGIPLGAAAVGGGVSLLADALIDRFLPQVTGPVANLAGAWALINWGGRFIGKDAARYGALFLTYEAISSYVEQLVGGLTKAIGAKAPYSAVAEAAQVASHAGMKQVPTADRYGGAF